METDSKTMDELTSYLCEKTQNKEKLIKILDTERIPITRKHIRNINKWYSFNIIKLFETYGYVFSNDDFVFLIKIDGLYIQYIRNYMDELISYLHEDTKDKNKLIKILNTKIKITHDHIRNINKFYDFNIIKLFRDYGYITTNDDYHVLIRIDFGYNDYIEYQCDELYDLARGISRFSRHDYSVKNSYYL